MTAAKSVGSRQGDDLGIVEAHATEDGAEMGLVFRSVRQATVRRAKGNIAVGAAGPPGDYGTLHLLYGGHASERPKVGIAYPGKAFCVEPIG